MYFTAAPLPVPLPISAMEEHPLTAIYPHGSCTLSCMSAFTCSAADEPFEAALSGVRVLPSSYANGFLSSVPHCQLRWVFSDRKGLLAKRQNLITRRACDMSLDGPSIVLLVPRVASGVRQVSLSDTDLVQDCSRRVSIKHSCSRGAIPPLTFRLSLQICMCHSPGNCRSRPQSCLRHLPPSYRICLLAKRSCRNLVDSSDR